MKITIESTTYDNDISSVSDFKVSKEINDDGLSMPDIINEFIIPCLIGAGWTRELILDGMNEVIYMEGFYEGVCKDLERSIICPYCGNDETTLPCDIADGVEIVCDSCGKTLQLKVEVKSDEL